MERWGVTDPELERGGLATKVKAPARREVFLLQRKTSEVGKGLGKTSGWVHRATLKDSGVEMLKGVSYDRIDDDGLHITLGEGDRAEHRVLDVDTVVLCTGQESVRDLVVQPARGRPALRPSVGPRCVPRLVRFGELGWECASFEGQELLNRCF